MWVCLQDFHTPKNGSSETEYEDAYSPDACFHRSIDGFRCAVADGASESAFSREWAQLLVKNFARHQLDLRHLQDIWGKLVKLRPLPWYLEAKVDKGAHAAFVGLSIRDGEHHSWRAMAIGDSCLFHVRDDQMLLAAPIDKSEVFDNNPYLLSTRCPTPISANAPHLKVLSGTWESKDAFYLATDALAQWLLSEEEDGRPPWTMLAALGTDAEDQPFGSLVKSLREEKKLHNDDTTLLRVEVV